MWKSSLCHYVYTFIPVVCMNMISEGRTEQLSLQMMNMNSSIHSNKSEHHSWCRHYIYCLTFEADFFFLFHFQLTLFKLCFWGGSDLGLRHFLHMWTVGSEDELISDQRARLQLSHKGWLVQKANVNPSILVD